MDNRFAKIKRKKNIESNHIRLNWHLVGVHKKIRKKNEEKIIAENKIYKINKKRIASKAKLTKKNRKKKRFKYFILIYFLFFGDIFHLMPELCLVFALFCIQKVMPAISQSFWVEIKSQIPTTAKYERKRKKEKI